MAHTQIKGHMPLPPVGSIRDHSILFTMIPSNTHIWLCKLLPQHHFDLLHLELHQHYIMNVMDYWLLAIEYFIWNAAVTALQFWTADLEAHALSSTIEEVYNAFFYTTSMHLLHQQSEEVLFSCFMTMLNATFESRLTLEDEDNESGSENFNIPTPL